MFKKKVGCVITNSDNRIIATGYNGRSAGLKHCEKICDSCTNNILYSVHAEVNAISNCESKQSIVNMYCTIAPCINCAKQIIKTNCKNFYFTDFYKSDAGIQLLRSHKIKVYKINCTL